MVGMTQAELAEKLGIRFQQVQKYESGSNRVAASRLWDIAQVVGVPVGYFFQGLLTESAEAEDVTSEAQSSVRFYRSMPSVERKKLRDIAEQIRDPVVAAP
ncbi:UNVERIFIED_CONTAM: hypothetical protein GTU68_029332 [Idotea baltica]|nr:hypothetical protein [Idotea baltica]